MNKQRINHLFKQIFTVIFLALALPVYAQTDTTERIDEDIIDNILGESTEETENSELIDIIENLKDNPVNINSADINELQRIPYIDFNTAEKIIKHREAYGKFFSKEELYSIKDIYADIVNKIIPLVTVGEENENLSHNLTRYITQSSYSGTQIKFRSRMSKSLQPQDGYTDNKFEGSQVKLYNRLICKYSENIQAGVLLEKDAGEKAANEFTSAHLSLKHFIIFDQIIAGDFNLQFGQGLAVWSPYGFSKGMDAISPAKKSGNAIVPYTSTDENNFFRGIAFTSSWKRLKFSGYISKNYFDASIDTSSNSILSVPLDGYHRTENELSKRKTASETSFGMNFSLALNKNINVGIFIYHSLFDKAFQPEADFDRAGSSFSYYSFYYDFYFLNLNIFGESVYNGKSAASLISLQFSNNDNFLFLISVRDYPKNYVNLHGLGFGERAKDLNNEFGIYSGIKWKLPIALINFYFDQFKFPAETYQNPMPSEGNELTLGINSKPFKSIDTKFVYRCQNKEAGTALDNLIRIVRRTRQSYRLEMGGKPDKNIRLKSRIEFDSFTFKDIASEKGIAFYNEVGVMPYKQIEILGRIIFFRTNSFNSAIYEYESSFNGMLSNVALYGEGLRWYFILRYKILSQIELSVKYSETYKPGEKTLGSGYNTINGNLDNSIYIQLDTEI